MEGSQRLFFKLQSEGIFPLQMLLHWGKNKNSIMCHIVSHMLAVSYILELLPFEFATFTDGLDGGEIACENAISAAQYPLCVSNQQSVTFWLPYDFLSIMHYYNTS